MLLTCRGEKQVKLFKKWLMKGQRKNTSITYEEMKLRRNKNPEVILLDVRSRQEYEEYHLPGSICIPLYLLEEQVEKHMPKDAEIIIYCQMGGRSKTAVKLLTKMGYQNVCHIEGGLDAIQTK